MDISYERRINKTYITIMNNGENENTSGHASSDDGNNDDEYIVKMLRENSIPGFFKVFSTNEEDRTTSYEVSPYISLTEYTKEKQFDSDMVVNLIQSVAKAENNAYEYLIPFEKVVIDKEAIFISRDSKEIKYVIDPFRIEGGYTSIENLADFIVQNVDYSDENAAFAAYEFYDMVKKNDYDYAGLIERIKSAKKEKCIEQVIESSDMETSEDSENLHSEDTIYAKEDSGKKSLNLMLVAISMAVALLIIATIRAF